MTIFSTYLTFRTVFPSEQTNFNRIRYEGHGCKILCRSKPYSQNIKIQPMKKEKKPDAKNSPPQTKKKLGWRQKMIDEVLGVDYVERRLLFENLNREEDENIQHQPSEEITDHAKIAERPSQDLSSHEDLMHQLEKYYRAQKKSDLRILEYCKEDYSKERLWKWLKYRWEFMRRSPDYIGAFEQEKKRGSEEDYSFNLFKRFEYWKSFGLICSNLPDPHLSFDELKALKNHNILDEPFFRINFITNNYRTDSGISYFTLLNEEINFSEFNRLQFNINFTKLTSIKEVKKIVNRLIDDHWRDYFQRLEQQRKPEPLDNYELILIVGDLKDKGGLSDEKIAEKIFEVENNLKLAARKVSIYYQKYKDLINGGYHYL